MSTLAPDVLLEKQKQLRGRLDYAASQVDLLEQMASFGASIDKSKYESARAEFIVAIPSASNLFGCSSSCSMFCKCSYHLFEPELAERHQLYMRYFSAKEAAKKFISEVEQTSFALPGVKRGYEVARKQTQVKRRPHSEEEQLEFQL